MTPKERQLIKDVGQDLLVHWIARLGTISLLYGITMPVVLMVTYSSAKRRVGLGAWLSRLAIICLGIIAFNGFFVVTFGGCITTYQHFFQKSNASLFQRTDDADILLAKWSMAQDWLEMIPPIINDAFIIWRAWVVFAKRPWALCLSIGLCLSTLAITLAYLSMFCSNLNVLMTVTLSNSTASYLSDATAISSFLSNFVATYFIGQTLWTHVKFLKTNMDNQIIHSFRLWHVLSLLVDAGAVYAVLQLLSIVFSFAVDIDSIQFSVIAVLQFSVSFVYPAITIALIHGPFSVIDVHKTLVSLRMSSPGTQVVEHV